MNRFCKSFFLFLIIVAGITFCTPAYAAENGYSYLLMPTQIIKLNNVYFIVDSNHNQIIYSDTLNTDLRNWKVMTRNTQKPHAITSDGEIYMVIDTDNNRILTFEKSYNTFKPLQTFEQVGIRPHYADYDYANGVFYVWSSMTGEMYLYKRTPGTNLISLQEVRAISELSDCYVRSFTISGDVILFPSVERSSILMVDKNTFEVLNEYPVPDNISGMVQISIIDGYFFVTVSTDRQYNLQMPAIIRAKTLEDFGAGNYENLYSLFGNNGTPYYVSYFDGFFYMIHENAAPSVYRFRAEDGIIYDIKGMFS
jgi:hypothetical protein